MFIFFHQFNLLLPSFPLKFDIQYSLCPSLDPSDESRGGGLGGGRRRGLILTSFL